MDGTLYSTEISAIPASAMQAIEKARRNGHKVFICTGRSLAGNAQYLNLDVDGFIFGAGSMIYAGGKRIYDQPINASDVTRLKKRIVSCGLGYSLEGGAGVYCDQPGYDRLLWYFSGGNGTYETQVARAMEACAYPEKWGSEEIDNIYKICALGKGKWDERYTKLASILEEPYILTNSLELANGEFVCGEITNKTITKATGIHQVLDYYNGELFDAIAIGDSANDIPMLKICAVAIAMGNAAQSAKDAADYITHDILDDGIYHAFKHYRLID